MRIYFRKLFFKFLIFIPIFLSTSPLLALILNLILPQNYSSIERVFNNLFAEKEIIKIVFNSIIFAFLTAFISLIIGGIAAFLLSYYNLKFKKLYLTVSILPLLIPTFIPSAILLRYLEKIMCNVNKMNFLFIISEETLRFILGVLILSISLYPIIFFPLYLGFKSIGRNFYEIAAIDVSKRKAFLIVSLIKLKAVIAVSFLCVFLRALIEFQVPDLMLIKVFSVKIFWQFSVFYDFYSAAFYSVIFLIILIFVFYILFTLLKEIHNNVSDIDMDNIKAQKPQRYNFLIHFVCFAVIIFPILFQMIYLLFQIGSAANFIKSLKSSYNEIITTMILSFTCGILITILSVVPAYCLKNNFRYKRIYLFVCCLPLIISQPIYGIGIIQIWNQKLLGMNLIYQSPLILIISWCSLFLPFGILLLWTGFKEIDDDLENAAKLDGASYWKIIRNIYFAPLKKYFMSIMLLSMILSFGEVGSSILLVPPGYTSLSIRIFNFLHYGMDNFVASLCIIQIVMTLLIIFLVSKLFSEQR